MMDRRDFLKKGLALGAGTALSLNSMMKLFESRHAVNLTILYTNDTHARLDPFPVNATEHAGLGGIARRATLVEQIRREKENVLLLDAGDIFQGTPWFNVYGGKVDLELMSKMGYDATTIGNHEFDNGLQGFADVAPAADFPFLCANYEVKDTPMNPFVQRFMVKEVGGLRIGIFGLGIQLDGNVRKELYDGVLYRDPVIWANGIARSLKEFQKCDMVICLSHLGYHYNDNRIDDRKLASRVDGVDLIIGGHTHTFLNEPELIYTPGGGKTLVTQAGHSGIVLGRLDLFFDDSGRISESISAPVTVE